MGALPVAVVYVDVQVMAFRLRVFLLDGRQGKDGRLAGVWRLRRPHERASCRDITSPRKKCCNSVVHQHLQCKPYIWSATKPPPETVHHLLQREEMLNCQHHVPGTAVLIYIRMLTATLLFFLPGATPACPNPWVPRRQPANRLEWGSRCLFVPPNHSASLFRCVDLCEEHGGAPACISSPEENRHVTANLADGADALWLGLYQNEPTLGSAKGWGGCVRDAAPNFTNWYEGEPDEFSYQGYQEDCAFLVAWSGQWLATACNLPVIWNVYFELSCLCARGNASDAFSEDLEALEATLAYNQRLLRRRTSTAFAAAVAIAVLPTLLLLGRAGWRQLRRGADAESSAGVQGTGASCSQSSATPAALSAARLRFAAVKRELYAARELAAGRRLHRSAL